ncbi:MAG: excinuclease ABC subunit UvrA [Simkaniaceae bacterium]|nr:excinuclease ABC subunit UvrA [Simkaniaceae bacterium]
MNRFPIVLKNVFVNNLKKISLKLEANQLIVITGVSGSGKSSLAFDTIYTEGQRRYIESLSTYARRHLGNLPKPDAELITGISPTIAIEQKIIGRNPRSSVATMTGIYDFMRVLFARIATPHCPDSGESLKAQSAEQIAASIEGLEKQAKILILAPYASAKKGTFVEDFEEMQRKGFTRVFVDGELLDLSEPLSLDKTLSHDVDVVIDRLIVKEGMRARLLEVIEQTLEIGKGLMRVYKVDSKEMLLFSKSAYSPKSKKSYPPLEPHDFSYNHPRGMCHTCEGLGVATEFDEALIIDPDLSIAEDCCAVAGSYNTVRWGNIYRNLARIYEFEINTPWKDLPKKAKKVFLYGTQKKWTRMFFVHPVKKNKWTDYVQWRGVVNEAKRRLSEAKSESYHKAMSGYMRKMPCPDCKGSKIRPYPAAARLGNKTIFEICSLSIRDCLDFFDKLKLSERDLKIGGQLKNEIVRRLRFLDRVGLHYLSMSRIAPTLSGGESQRVRLASQIGSGIVSATYVLDEPSIGLHQRDHEKLLGSLLELRDQGNTVIVVEHDEQTMRYADWVVDIGPLAGSLGGKITAEGTVEDILKSKESLTGAYLRGEKEIAIPKKRRKAKKEKITIHGATHHNLKNVTVDIPLGIFVTVTGVSGSGKSSLIRDILYPSLSEAKLEIGAHESIEGKENIDKVISIDQSPIGRTPRSNPGTYIKVFDEIRNIFSQTKEAKAHGYKPGRFSFNVREGSCGHCRGMGEIRIDMDFMEDAFETCAHCSGRRFDMKTLAIEFKGKNIFDVLEMTVCEAYEFFENIPTIQRKLNLLMEVGLEYVKIGQSATTLSGGEAQRIKLSKELSRVPKGNTLYILDEPTTGLHFHDINKLIGILQKLTDKGNTVVVIEHNLELIKTSDWIIDLGPEGGDGGGTIVSTGTPEQTAKIKSPTGIFLNEALKKIPPSAPKERQKIEPIKSISILDATQHNLKNLTLEIPRDKITVCTGPSGSGKTSLALDTIFAEGQRRYVDSLPPYARQFLPQMPKPSVGAIDGLSPAIAIEQKKHAGNPRSTVGTMTEIHDYLRLLYTRLGVPHCPETGEQIRSISPEYVMRKTFDLPEKTKVQILAPLVARREQDLKTLCEQFQKQGYLRLRLNGEDYAIDEEIPFNQSRKNSLALVIDRLQVKKGIEKRMLDAIDIAAQISNRHVIIALPDREIPYNLAFAVESTGKSYPSITPHTFSFNSQDGMCLECTGLGFLYGANLREIPEVMEMSPMELMAFLWKEEGTRLAYKLFLKFAQQIHLHEDLELKYQPDEALEAFLHGTDEIIHFPDEGFELKWVGVETLFAILAKTGSRPIKEALSPMLESYTCPSCSGHRLNPLARKVTIKESSICDLCEMPIHEVLSFIQTLEADGLEEVIDGLTSRLQFLLDIGLHYLSLNRSAPTLSGGETQRVRLSRQLGCGLTGCLYILDEPTIGLHPHNNSMLNKALERMRDAGNTLILVEHDPMTIQMADHVIDFGPGAGVQGGQILSQGSIKDSPTGKYLTGEKTLPERKKRPAPKEFFEVRGAKLRNLKNLDLDIPVGRMTCFTGVSGSGKSTLMMEVIKPQMQKELDSVIAIDQSPIGHTKRSDVCTYTDLLTPLRSFYASLPEAKMRGLQPRHFSFNHVKGMCSKCQGMGYQTIDLQYMPSVEVACETCHGDRLAPLSRKVLYKEKNLGQVLRMSIQEALEFLPPIAKITRICETLISIGLGYLELGRGVATLSAGEAQRLRLTKELIRRPKGKTLYLFDEPTTGLHFEDIAKLLDIFTRLVDKGHTLLLIEHNLDVISRSDYIFDIGPEAGEKGGKIVAHGTPEKIAKSKKSLTGKYL